MGYSYRRITVPKNHRVLSRVSALPFAGNLIMKPLVEYYQCPQAYLDFHVANPLQEASGYFRYGPDLTCYGQIDGYSCPTVNGHLFDASAHVRRHGSTSFLPFDP